MKKNEFWTIPNMITSYRLLMVPVILYFAISGREKLFAIFLVINLLTDILDGYVARRFNMETEIGAKLDSFADNFSYVLAFVGFFIFKMDDFMMHIVSFSVFIGMLLLTVIVPLIKFHKFPSFHLYITKIGGYIQGTFFVCLFIFGFITPFYYLMIVWGILGAVECIIIDLIIPEMRSNVKGLYWVLKERNAEKKQQK